MFRRRLPVIYGGIWIIVVIIHILILIFGTETDHVAAITEAVIFNTAFALIGVGLWYMVRYSDLNSRSWLELLFVHLTGVTVVILIWVVPAFQILKLVFRENIQYVEFLDETLTIRIVSGIVYYFIIVTIAYLIVNIRSLRDQQKKEAELQHLLKDAELSMLRFQINPHFLFNSLNSISALTITRPEEAHKMVLLLSDFMRYSLESSGKVMSTLGKETEHCRQYLSIEQIRFGDRLNVEISADESLFRFPVPSMLLQPLVENAVKYGLNDSEAGIVITVKAITEDENLLIEVVNPVGPAGSTNVSGTGTGLKNIRERLAKIYGRWDLMTIINEDNAFRVIIKIPDYGRKDQQSDNR